MGDRLRAESEFPELILSSSAVRALQTAELFAEANGFDGELRALRDLYAHYPDPYIQVLSEVDDRFESVLVVGHNPGVEELLEMLTGDWERMPTAALAQVKLPIQSWSELDEDNEGELVFLWRPRDIL